MQQIAYWTHTQTTCDLCPNPSTVCAGGPHALCSLPVGPLCLVRWINMENWHSPAWSRHGPSKIIKDPHQKVVLFFFGCFLFVLDVLLTFFWSLFCWCGTVFVDAVSLFLLGGCFFVVFDVSQILLKSLWHVTFFIGLPHPNTKHANPTSGGDQSYPLTLAANLAEPSYVHSGVYQETSLAKVVQWTMEQTEIMINHDQHIMNKSPSVLMI